MEGDAGRSLAIRLYSYAGKSAGRWQDYATGEFGDLLTLIQHNTGALNTWDAMKTALQFLGEPDLAPQSRKPAAPKGQASGTVSSKADAGARLFSIGKPIAGTPAEAYLRNRGITRFGDALRFHPNVYLLGKEGNQMALPAKLAAITDNQGQVTGCARTWLDPQTSTLASIAEPRVCRFVMTSF